MTDPKQIVRAVSVATGISTVRIRGPLRHRMYSRARFVAALVMRWDGWSFNEIGAELGGRDHSTTMQQVRSATHDLDLLAQAADIAVRCDLERSALT